jgi:hypothetical protein
MELSPGARRELEESTVGSVRVIQVPDEGHETFTVNDGVWIERIRIVVAARPRPKLVEMVVEPTHGVLDGNVEAPERVGLRNLDAAPHERIGPAQHDEDLVNGRWSLSSGLHLC